MVKYVCNICNYSTNIKTHYNRHLETKKHKNNEIERTKKDPPRSSQTLRDPPRSSQTLRDPPGIKNTDIECEFCKVAVNSKNINRHYRNSCLKIPKNFKNALIEKYYKDKRNKNKQLALIINHEDDCESNKLDIHNNYKLSNGDKNGNSNMSSNNIINNTTNNNSNNTINNFQQNNNITVKINPLGKEDISFLTDKDKLEILMKRYMGVPELIKRVHDNPSNHNFYMPNVNKKILAYLNNENKLEYDNYDEVCDQIIEDNIQRFDDFFGELEQEMNKSIKNKVRKVIEDNNKDVKINKKYIDDIKYYLMNRSKEYKNDISDYINKIDALIKQETKKIEK